MLINKICFLKITTEQPSVYAIQSLDNQNSETKTSQSVIEEPLPSEVDNSSTVNDNHGQTTNTND